MDRRNLPGNQAMPAPAEAVVTEALHQPHRLQTTLQPYQGVWTQTQAAHLARRCLFGPKLDEIDALTDMGFEAAVNTLLTEPPLPTDLPINSRFDRSTTIPLGETWVDKFHEANTAGPWRQSLKSWWIGLMVNQGLSIVEKMTLFWHNHFAAESTVYKDPRFAYRHVNLLRTHALGNFQTLVEEVTVDPAMLRYLNGRDNTKNKPNENYARELFELFTIGKGPQIGPGDYTNYTENDVLEAAKVLTGWKDQGYNSKTTKPGVVYQNYNHDTTTKTFSAAFNNQTISNLGDQEYKALIDMIFQQKETARFISRKLYRWFVYYEIDAQTEQGVIEPMADLLVANNFEVKPVVEALLKSEHFYDELNIGGLLKNPMDFILSPVRQLEMALPDPVTKYEASYDYFYKLYQEAAIGQMDLLDPPSVAGWPAYYQAPQYHELWVNSGTLPPRTTFTNKISQNGYRFRGVPIVIDPLPILDKIPFAQDPNEVVGTLASLLLPQPLPLEQLDYLKSVILPGLPDYEWQMEYDEYKANPGNTNLARSIANKLKALLETIMGLPEFYLS